MDETHVKKRKIERTIDMNKEQLIKLGLTEAQAEAVMAAHGEAINGAYVPKNRFDEVNNAKKGLEAQIASLSGDIKARDNQLKDLQANAGDNEKLKAEITKLQEANKLAKKEYDKQLYEIKLDTAVEAALGEAQAKNSKAVKALLDMSIVKLGEDGKLLGLKEQLENMKASEDTNFLFKSEEGQGTGQGDGAGAAGAQGTRRVTGTEPGQGEKGQGVDFSKMSYSELEAYYNSQENNA